MLDSRDVIYWVWLSSKMPIASAEFPKLLKYFGDPFELYRMEPDEIEQMRDISDSVKEALTFKSLDAARETVNICKQKNIEIITYADSIYPDLLREIGDPPILLYCKGRFPDMNSSLCIGVVGTRRMSDYGMGTTYKMTYELARAGVVVVSGMALGIDGVSACATLEAGGSTVCVLGSGIDRIYPTEHKRLYESIVRQGGAVVSEYPLGTPPLARNFPIRNRIISGMSKGTVVMEGAIKSGSMITANLAINQGRELFALPGRVGTVYSDGPNALIRDGAHIALGSEDILEFYRPYYSNLIDAQAYFASRAVSDIKPDSLSKYGVLYRRPQTPAEPLATQPTVSSKGARNAAKNVPSTSASPTLTQAKKTAPRPTSAEQGERIQSAPTQNDPILATLDAASRRVYEAMPTGVAVTADALTDTGMDIGEIITAMTMLQICGLVTSMPGGQFLRK